MFVRCYLRVALLFAFFLVSIIITANASGYDSNRFNVIVMFKPGTVEFPVGVTEALPGEIYYSRSGIKEIMLRCNVQYILKIAPNFNRADTLEVTRTGEIVKVTDWSHTYILQLINSIDADNATEQLNDLPEVIHAELEPITVNGD